MAQETKFTLLSDAISSIIHELNQPLTMMNFVSETLFLLAEQKPDSVFDDLKEMAVQVKHGAMRHRELLEHLRDLIQDNPTPRPINLNEVVQTTLQILRSRLNAHQLIVKTAKVQPVVLVPSARLRLLVFALIFSIINRKPSNGISPRQVLFKTVRHKKTVDLHFTCTARVKSRAHVGFSINEAYLDILQSLVHDLGAMLSFPKKAALSISIKFALFQESPA
jgi:light-regulated signal transduction histidine kinase (bacteriophytochrome)